MSIVNLGSARGSNIRRHLTSPDELGEALGIAFSDQQLAAITAPLEPGVIIAGAGSGKTTVMAARVVWLVGTGAVRPEEVLGLTFTRKAAAELSQRVRTALLDAGVITDRGIDEAGEQVIMTYDAFAARLVTEHGLRIGVEADPTMITGATRFRLASRVVKAAAGPFDHISRLKPATITDRVLRLDAEMQQHLVGHAELDRQTRNYQMSLGLAPLNNRGNVYADVKKAAAAAEERLELASLVGDYQNLKRHLGMVEFADQMSVAARLAREVPRVATALRDTFRVVLLDEYQDTSAAQALMLQGLFSGASADEGRGHPVTAVGDPFQAIYGWRGAAASNILQFDHDFPKGGGGAASSFTLTVNRRSGQSILDVANELARPLRECSDSGPGQPSERRPGLSSPAPAPGLGKCSDAVTAVSAGAGGHLLRAPKAAGRGEVRAATFDSWPEEISWICAEVLNLASDRTVASWAEIAILTRRNADIAPLYAELTSGDVPVEIVGLGGLLNLPEVMDVVSTLRVIDDVTANPEVIRLLTGPRWNIGPGDLALLGRRARQLAQDHQPERMEGSDHELLDALEEAVADVDPTDVICLVEALDSPGDLPYATEARERFASFAAELQLLRSHSDEPVLDLTRRVIGTLGLDVELLATPQFARTSRRDQLAVFVDAVGGYVDVDGDASLAGLLAYLQAELDQGTGLDQAVPSDRDAVKLLTVHKAKGLEWTVVFLPALMQGIFPTDRVTDNWVSYPAALPAELRGDAGSIPQLEDTSNAALVDYRLRLKEQQSLSEDRLAYVAATRAKRVLVGSGHHWRADGAKPRRPSAYLRVIMDQARRQDRVAVVAEAPGPTNPLIADAPPQPWPRPLDPQGVVLRREAAASVARARARARQSGSYELPLGQSEPLLLDQEEVVAGWDADLERLVEEARNSSTQTTDIPLPGMLSATALIRARRNPKAFAAQLARPMPTPPSRSARFGTRFHQWAERYIATQGMTSQRPLIDPDDLPDRADAGAADEVDLRALCTQFAEGQFGQRTAEAVETPFALLMEAQTIRGRIDAVYRAVESKSSYDYLVVDWKTSESESADPLQLSIYRIAWAELRGVPVERVDAVFYYVRSDRVVRPEVLHDHGELATLLGSVVGLGPPAQVRRPTGGAGH